jgi:uncharacterized membrane protein
MKIIKSLLPIALVLAFSIFTILPFLQSGFFPMHDDTQVARVFEMAKGLSNGMFPVRWSMDLGYGFGYPIFNFYDPLPYYIGGLIEMIGLNALLATKLMMIIGLMLSGVSMYLFAKEFWGKSGGVLSALFYTFAPYHALDIYVRGDVAEFWAFAFIPLIFYSLLKIHKKDGLKFIAIGALSYAAVIISHNLTALMITPFILGFLILLAFGNRKTFKEVLIVPIFGFVIAAFYWLPAVLEMSYTNVSSLITGGSNFRDHFVCINQLWTSPWGYGGSAKGCVDGLSFMVGKYHLVLALLLFIFALLALVSRKYFTKLSVDKLVILIFAFVGLLISLFFTLQISQPIWELVRPMAFFQYPWRFLLTAVFFASFISGAAFWILEKYIKKNVAIILLLIISSSFLILVSQKFFVPKNYLYVNSDYYTNTHMLNWTTSRISDEYLSKNFKRPQNENNVANFSKLNSLRSMVTNVRVKTQIITLDVNAFSATNLTIPLAYFPAWQAEVDGKRVSIVDNAGQIKINVPEGVHQLKLEFKQTPIELFADILSLSGILVLFAGIIQLKKKYA